MRWLALLLALVATLAAAAEPEVRVRTRLAQADSPMVGGTLELQVDLLVDTWFSSPPQLQKLELEGALDSAPSSEATHLTEQIDGRKFFGLRFVYRISPQRAQRFDIPLAVTFHALGLVRRQHQGSADAFPPQRIAIERQLVQQAAMVIAECPQDREDLLRLYAADAARIATVPCGVDTQLFVPGNKAGARRRLGWSDDEFVVLQLGRLVPRKGIDNVILGLARLPRGLRVRLVVVGGDTREPDELATPEIARLRALAREAGVEDRVSFTGHRRRAELPDFYVGADVFVTTPWYEPFGITPLEAMACGCPVIGSAVGGIKYTVIDSVTGYLVPPNDPVRLAERLAHLRRNPALSRAFGRAGILRVRSAFTWRRATSQLARVYASVVNLRALRRAARMAQT